MQLVAAQNPVGKYVLIVEGLAAWRCSTDEAFVSGRDMGYEPWKAVENDLPGRIQDTLVLFQNEHLLLG